ncbi:hypothetical protein ILUMI_19134 [Ignelater luminosus]|uniref:PiggyBac transposable element-derived protein domain-containing protein n=1 Tax=Ignelater luminosus TaxID=2038154 RepID=A0A8K0G5R4_IGNLU|nr:hypothetical protein ILUMI_19134 [Ignelater luminosus]
MKIQGRKIGKDKDKEQVGCNNNEHNKIDVEKTNFNKICWVRGDLECAPKYFPNPDYKKFKCLTPTEMFKLFFTEDVVCLLVTESHKYAEFKNIHNYFINSSEMKCFLSSLILSGYNFLPDKDFYWDTRDDMGNTVVKKCTDNAKIDKSDKFYKLRLLIEKLKANFIEHSVPEEGMNYDESMNLERKHQKWYLVIFITYQSADSGSKTDYQNVFGKAAAPFVTMLDELSDDKRNLQYSLYIDNLFTSFHLLNYFRDFGYVATGTIRDNRVPKNCPLLSTTAMIKKSRGEYHYVLNTTNGILLVRWVDNNIVSLASTKYGIQPLGEVRRYSQTQKKNIQVSRPLFVSKYNWFMGGTDLMDEKISRYWIGIRGKECW